DQRLQQKIGDQGVERLEVDVHRDREAALEPRLLDFEVLLQHLELLLQRDLLGARCVERHPKEVTQAIDHQIGRIQVDPHQPGNRVQRVEQKVRVKLALHRLQLRLHQTGLQMGGVEGARLRLAAVGQRVREANQEQVRHQHPVKLSEVFQARVPPERL